MQPLNLSSILRLKLIIYAANLQSIKVKESLPLDQMTENKIDVIVVTETWLISDGKDIVWAK